MCPYIDDGEKLTWWCIHESLIDDDGIGKKLGDNTSATLNGMPDWCSLEEEE